MVYYWINFRLVSGLCGEAGFLSVHNGHRGRRKELFRKYGLDAFTDHEALELLLFYALPQKDVNGLAHTLIQTFGSLENVLTASPEELEEIGGVGAHTATLLNLVLPLARCSQTVYAKEPTILRTTEEAGEHFLRLFHGEREELIYEACLDAKGKLLRCALVGRGGVDAVALNLRRIVEIAFLSGACVVILAHNHPSGIALPSPDDNESTLRAWDALRRVGVTLADHIIVADGDFVSLRDNGLLSER